MKNGQNGTPFEGTRTTIRRMRRRVAPVLQGVLLAGSFLFLTAVVVGVMSKEHDATDPGLAGLPSQSITAQTAQH